MSRERREDRERGDRPGRLRRVLSRLTEDQDSVDAAAERDVATGSGGEPIATCADRCVVTVSGTLRAVTLRPRAGVPALEAELWDGTGVLLLVWLGRRRIAGISPGRRLTATGRVSTADGQRVVFNPRYELKPAAAHA
jgi:hypothetical protein